MRGNIPKLYLSNLLTGLVFWYSVEKLFMYSIGINAFGVSINAVVLVAVTTLFDVPFGVLADRWSRKYTLALGMVALAIGSLIAGASHSLFVYTIGTAVYGLYLCLTNGTFQAITYDSLQAEDRANLYAKHQGGSYALFMAGIALASPLGGLMAHAYGYRSTYYVSAALCAANIAIILSMHEPTFHKLEARTKIRNHIGEAAKAIWHSQTLLYLCSIMLVAGMLRSSLNEYAGLYFIAVGFGAIGSGWANGGKWLFGAAGQFWSAKIARFYPWMVGVFFVAFAVMSSWRTPLGLIFFYLATFSHGVVQNETQALIQNRVSSSLRATILSLVNFGSSALMIPLGLGFGWIAQHRTVFRAYQLFAVIGIAYLVVWVFWRRRVSITPTSNVAIDQPQLT